MKLVCIRHPKYDGKSPPILSCKTCCTLFVDQVKQDNKARSFDAYEFLDRKTKESKKARSQHGNFDFNPELI